MMIGNCVVFGTCTTLRGDDDCNEYFITYLVNTVHFCLLFIDFSRIDRFFSS